jgi:hypothetical protein
MAKQNDFQLKAAAKRIEKREAQRQARNLKKCEQLSPTAAANLEAVVNLMIASAKLAQGDDYTDSIEAGLGEHILDNPTVSDYLENALKNDIGLDEFENICKQVLEHLFHKQDIILTSTTAMTDMSARPNGEALGAYHARFLALNKARTWIHALYGVDYVPDSDANATLWLRKVNCQPITLALTSTSLVSEVTAAQLYTAAENLLRNGTLLDEEPKGNTKEWDLNMLQVQNEMHRNNMLNMQQQLQQSVRDQMQAQHMSFKEELRNRDEAALSYLNSSHQDKKHRNHLNTEQSSRENNDRLRDQHARRFRSERYMRGGLP